MSEYKSDVIEYTPFQIKAGKIVALAFTVILAVWYILVATNVVPLPFWKIFLGSLLATFGLILIVSGYLQCNCVSVFLSAFFLVPATLSILGRFDIVSYSTLYPLYIMIPAIASLLAIPVSKTLSGHVKCMIVFIVAGAFYFLNVFGVISIAISVVASIVWALAVIVYIVYRMVRREE